MKKPTPSGKRPAPVAPAPAKVPPLFRRADWFAAAITFAVIWTVYLLTLAPELTLEDCGELVTGSFYAGIPHPPGYPVWTIYSWLWTLLPFGNVAWRVALAEAFSGAVSCALIALMVTRGSALLIDGIESLQRARGRLQTAIGMVSGITAGLLMGLDGFMWRESVAANRIAVSSLPWLMLVLLCLFRWLYAPHQLRFLYWAFFLFGICFTTHQSLIVAAMGIEILIAAANPRLGRDVFLANGVVYLAYNFVVRGTGEHLFANLGAKPGLLLIFHAIGIGSLIAGGWLAVRTRGLLREWKPVLIAGLLWFLGASFYLYMPIACMTNPPMQWCYPRTVGGFFHALTRGQYEQPNPTNLLSEPGRFLGQLGMLVGGLGDSFTWLALLLAVVPFLLFRRMQKRERSWLIGLAALYLCLGVLLMILLNPTPDRSSADLVKVFFNSSHSIVAALIGYGIALTAACLVAHYEKFRRWGLLGGALALALAFYSLVGSVGRHFFGPAGTFPLSQLPHWIGQAFTKNQHGLPVYAELWLLAIPLIFLTALVFSRRRAPLALALGLFLALPGYSGMAHWSQCDQRGHMFGYYFGHDMFSPPFKAADGQPIYPEMTRDAVLFGGTDPGRFCPTYMIFCESFIPPRCRPVEDQKFDRRDVYIITQNALVDPPYQNYIRAHYNRSRQLDPPFFSELCRYLMKDQAYQTNLLARLARPLDSVFGAWGDHVEKRRRASSSWFTPSDFTNLDGFAHKLRPIAGQDPLSRFLFENLSLPTQKLVCASSDGPSLSRHLARDLNSLLERELELKDRIARLRAERNDLEEKLAGSRASARVLEKYTLLDQTIDSLSKIEPLYQPSRFKGITLAPALTRFVQQNPESHTRIRLNRELLEAAYPDEIAVSSGGLYPDREIYIPSAEDGQACFQAYCQDAHRRKLLGQLRPGEEVEVVGDRIQVKGQAAIMAINGLVARVIFEQNPNHEFFVEESAPIDWMFPHLTPFGIIMKINRVPLTSLPAETFEKDHLFWKQYSQRLTGDFIDYDTTVRQVADWIERTYVRRNFAGFTGDRRFVHDIDAQKSFCKLRTAIAGVYAWRLSRNCPAEFRPKSEAELQQLWKEANFAFLQAFAFCPFNPELIFRYANLLLESNRLDDALILAETCLKLDPFSTQVAAFRSNLRDFKKQQVSRPL